MGQFYLNFHCTIYNLMSGLAKLVGLQQARKNYEGAKARANKNAAIINEMKKEDVKQEQKISKLEKLLDDQVKENAQILKETHETIEAQEKEMEALKKELDEEEANLKALKGEYRVMVSKVQGDVKITKQQFDDIVAAVGKILG